MMAYLGSSPFVTRTFDPKLRLFELAPQPHRFYPRAMGNMVVGRIVAMGGELQDFRIGQCVFAWAPIADCHVLPADRVHPLGELTPEQALCIDPASFALGADQGPDHEDVGGDGVAHGGILGAAGPGCKRAGPGISSGP